MTNQLPYTCFPKCMTRAIVRGSAYFYNAFPSTTGLSDMLSPRNIIDQQPNLDRKKLLAFGLCVELAVDKEITNTQRSRTISAIVLDPRDYNGAYSFMSLSSGREVSGRVVRKIPMNNKIVELVNNIGGKQEQPVLVNGSLVFEWIPGFGIENDDDDVLDDDFDQDNHDNDEIEAAPNPIDGFENIDHGLDGENESEEDDEDMSQVSKQDADIEEIQAAETQVTDDNGSDDDELSQVHHENEGAQPDEEEGALPDKDQRAQESPVDENVSDQEEIIVKDVNEDNDGDKESVYISEPVPERRKEEKEKRGAHFDIDPDGGKGKRRKMSPKFLNYSFLNFQCQGMNNDQRKQFVRAKYVFLQTKYDVLDEDTKDLFLCTAMHEFKATESTKLVQRYATGFSFTQMTAKAGLKKHGKLAEQALMKEFMQLLDLDVLSP